jgi:DNA adenine methylase
VGVRPLLRWAGSKRKLLPRLHAYWVRAHAKRYIEPFAGSAANFFHIEPAVAVLSDVNAEVVGFYRAVQRHAADVFSLAATWSIDAATYYRLREELKVEKDDVRRAATFFYLNRTCFNGIFRTNRRGEFNVPFSGVKTGAFPSWDEFQHAVQALDRAEIALCDFETLITREVAEGDFVYLDPPYAVENRRVFVQYNAQTFGTEDLQRLSDLLHCIDAAGASFLLSYAMAPEAHHFFSGWHVCRTSTQRNVAGFVRSRRKANELLVSNLPMDIISTESQS